MNRGFVKIYRKIEENFLWETDEPYCKRMAWVDLILTANHEENTFMKGGQRFTVKKGQHFYGREQLAARWKWSLKKVDNFLNLLQEEGMIYKETNTKGTIITLVNYGDYQGFSDKKEKQKIQQKEHQKTQQKIDQKIEQKNIRGTSEDTTEDALTIMNKNDIKNELRMNKKKDFFEDY